jgi:Holliday junction resolvase
MGNQKGAKAERELVKMFTHHGWRALRVAGSGRSDDSPCDIIAGKARKRAVAIECKSSKKKIIYVTRKQVEEFMMFATMMGMKPLMAVRFDKIGWYFLEPKRMKPTEKNWAIKLDVAQKRGKKFGQMFG